MLKSFPGILLTVLIPFWKPDEFSIFSIIYMLIALCLLILTLWGMLRAFRAVKSNNLEKRFKEVDPVKEMVSAELQSEGTAKTKKPIWPWIVIGSGALLLIGAGPGALMLPIMPLFLAVMSTDSGSTPDYVPLLIVIIGYGIIVGYTLLLIKAIKILKAK